MESIEAGEETTDRASETGSASYTGEIKSREDIVRLLDKACEYFKRNEPSSPVPLLLQRAKRLISADFMEVMRELAPDGLSQAKKNAGVELE
jgi:type VI secretion system protein ImpA